MTNCTIAELLVLFLIFISSIRFYISRDTSTDSLAVVPLIALCISFLNILAFGLTPIEILIFLHAFIVFLINFPSLVHLAGNVIVDYFGTSIKIVSVFIILITLALGFLAFYFRPMNFDPKKYGTVENTYYCKGNFEDGFTTVTGPFNFSTNKICEFTGGKNNIQKKLMEQNGRIIIFFIPPKTSTTKIYTPMLHKLAKDGYTVYSGEFHVWNRPWLRGLGRISNIRRFQFLKMRRDFDKYSDFMRFHRQFIIDEYEALFDFVKPEPNDKIFLLTDEDISNSMRPVYENHSDIVYGFYDLANTEYSEKGYGPVENTDPLFAKYLGFEFDRSGYLSSHLASGFEAFMNVMLISERPDEKK